MEDKQWAQLGLRSAEVRRAADFPSPTPLPTPCRLWQGPINSGYGVKGYERGGKRKRIYAHRWVAAQIHGWPAIEGLEVLHLCDNKLCFRYDHLQIGTHAENMRMAGDRGQVGGGPGVPRKLPEEAEEIRYRLAQGETEADLAVEYGVSASTVHNIRHRRYY